LHRVSQRPIEVENKDASGRVILGHVISDRIRRWPAASTAHVQTRTSRHATLDYGCGPANKSRCKQAPADFGNSDSCANRYHLAVASPNWYAPRQLPLASALPDLDLDPAIVATLAGSPTVHAQSRLLELLLLQLKPLLRRRGLRLPFRCEPGVRLKRRYGLCRFEVEGQALILVRCTRDDDRGQWRRPSAIVGTLIHELSHLRHRRHTPTFWRFCRALLDDAATLGLYSGESDDPAERPQGRGRLAGSAADALVIAERAHRREQARAARELVTAWPIGSWACIRGGSIGVRCLPVQVLVKRRTRLLVQARDGQRYLVSPSVVELLAAPADAGQGTREPLELERR
jgi:WLM domain-containing protein